jgi:hypothetical protein
VEKMAHDIFEKHKERERDAKLFRSLTGKDATALFKSDPAEYQRLKAADRAGDPNPQSGVRPSGIPMNKYVETPAEPLSDYELSLLLKYPTTELEKFYVTNGDKRNPDNTHILAKKLSDSPDAVNGFVPRSAAEQLEIRNAAILHGILQGTVRFPAQEVKPAVVDDERVNAGKLGELAGLPPGARVTPKQYNDLLDADARRLAARSPSEVAQDRVAALRLEADRVQASLDKAKS